MEKEEEAARQGSQGARKLKYLKGAFVLVAVAAIALALVPWYSGRLVDRSLDQAGKGYQVESLHSAESAASWDPVSIDALLALAGADERMGWQEQAQKTLEKATRLEPLNYLVWEQLAIYERDYWHKKASAREHFAKAISLNPQDEQLRQEAAMSARGS